MIMSDSNESTEDQGWFGDAWDWLSDAVSDAISFVSEEVVDPINTFVSKGFESVSEAFEATATEIGQDLVAASPIGTVARAMDTILPGRQASDLLDTISGNVAGMLASGTTTSIGYLLEGLGFESDDRNPSPIAAAAGGMMGDVFTHYASGWAEEIRPNTPRQQWEDRIRRTEVGTKLAGQRSNRKSRSRTRRSTPFYGRRQPPGSTAGMKQPRVVYH
jgi:hypothetical protein